MKRKLLISIKIAALSLIVSAQNEIDALRYSQSNIFGTAKFSSMSGAYGALGGDFSSLSYNPAGIGFYEFNEISFSPVFYYNNITSYRSTRLENDKIGGNIGSFGIIFSMPQTNDSKFKRINIGLGTNMINTYDHNIRIEGENNTSSMTDKILELANGNTIDNLNPLNTSLAFWTDLIDLQNNTIDSSLNPQWYLYDNGNYISHIKNNSNKLQTKNIRSSGSQHEFIVSLGGSLNEKIYLGATIGFPTLNYYELSVYTEDVLEDTINNLEGFSLEEELSTNGDGINIKGGAIIRISENFKIGASLHSPTYFNIEESYTSAINTYFSSNNYTEISPSNYFEYELITPWKGVFSASAIFNKYILLSADLEIVDYSFTKLNSASYDFRYENEAIQNSYQKTNNFRIGSEINFDEIKIRAGYSKYGSPYTNNDFYQEGYSFGIGLNRNNYFLDIAYTLSQNNEEHKLYSEEYINPTLIINTNHNILLTLGIRY